MIEKHLEMSVRLAPGDRRLHTWSPLTDQSAPDLCHAPDLGCVRVHARLAHMDSDPGDAVTGEDRETDSSGLLMGNNKLGSVTMCHNVSCVMVNYFKETNTKI